MIYEQLHGQSGGRFGQLKAEYQGWRKNRFQCTQARHQCVRQPGQPQGVALRLVIAPGADALADYRNQRQPDGAAGNLRQHRHRIRHSIGGQGNGSKGGDQALQQDLPHLEHAVFQAVRDADGQDLPNHTRTEFPSEQWGKLYRMRAVAQQ